MTAVIGVGVCVCLLHALVLWLVWRATLPSHPEPVRASRRMEMVYMSILPSIPLPPPQASTGRTKPPVPNRNRPTQAVRAATKVPSTTMTWLSAQPLAPADQDVATDATRGHDPEPSTKPRTSDLLLTLPNSKDGAPRQKSYSEMANEQIKVGERRDALADGIKSAAIPDCLKDDQSGGLLGLPIMIYKATTGKCRK